MSFKDQYPDFHNPIEELGADVSKLTDKAKDLVEGDLIALSWGQHTERTDKLGVRDINSINEAFENHSFKGHSQAEAVGGSCCCCCAPCCCTAAAVVDTVEA